MVEREGGERAPRQKTSPQIGVPTLRGGLGEGLWFRGTPLGAKKPLPFGRPVGGLYKQHHQINTGVTPPSFSSP